MGRKDDQGYQQWLIDADEEDTTLNYKWYRCPEEESSDFIKKHRDWWDSKQ